MELVLLALLLLVPYYDRRANVSHQNRVRKIVRVRSSWRVLYGGGSSGSNSPLLVRTASRNSNQPGGCSYGSFDGVGGGSFPASPATSYHGAGQRDELDVLDEDASYDGLRF